MGGLRPRHVVPHLGRFDCREHRPLLDVISDVRADFLHAAGDLGHYVYFLERDELGREEYAASQFRRFCSLTQ